MKLFPKRNVSFRDIKRSRLFLQRVCRKGKRERGREKRAKKKKKLKNEAGAKKECVTLASDTLSSSVVQRETITRRRNLARITVGR